MDQAHEKRAVANSTIVSLLRHHITIGHRHILNETSFSSSEGSLFRESSCSLHTPLRHTHTVLQNLLITPTCDEQTSKLLLPIETDPKIIQNSLQFNESAVVDNWHYEV